ncbi:Retinol dehydrogenase 7 [Bulinus truncatus]|nr:Retinol dehydrogenase 7 [Bulinus truncatus]
MKTKQTKNNSVFCFSTSRFILTGRGAQLKQSGSTFSEMIWIISLIVVSLVTYILFVRALRSLKVGSYEDRYVLITGCGAGFGKGLACHLDQLGFHVIAGCRTERGMKYLKENCSERLVTLQLDVSNNKDIEAALLEVKRLLPDNKGLWGLVNNAGIAGVFGISEILSKEDYYKVLDVNLLGLIEMTRHFLPLIRKARGRVVNMSSVGGRVAASVGAYGVSKFGVEAYSDILRRELYHRGVKVSIIEPGSFKTSMANRETILKDIKQLFHERCTEEIKESYGNINVIYDRMFGSMLKYVKPDISPVVEAYTHALTSRYPKTRYIVGWDAKLICIPLTYLPDCLSDPILALPYLN